MDPGGEINVIEQVMIDELLGAENCPGQPGEIDGEARLSCDLAANPCMIIVIVAEETRSRKH
jgi:hypothetical protein